MHLLSGKTLEARRAQRPQTIIQNGSGGFAMEFNGTDEYLTRALPTNLLINGTFETGVNTDGWTVGGTAVWNDTETGKTGNYCLKLTGSAGIITKSGILTIGKKYKLAIRYKSINTLQVRNSGSGSTYVAFGSTSQWNQIYYTFTATSTDLVLRINSDTAWIDDISIVEDWKMDLNESYELIKHSINRDFEQSYVTTYTSNFTAGVDTWNYSATVPVEGNQTAYGETACLKLTPSLVNESHATREGSAFTNSNGGRRFMVTIKYYIPSSCLNLKRLKFYSGSDASMDMICEAKDAWTTASFEVPNNGFPNLWLLLQNAAGNSTFLGDISDVAYIKDVIVREIPNLVTNGSFTTDTDWTKGAGWSINTSTGKAVATNITGATITSQSGNKLITGKKYRYYFELSNVTSGSVAIWGGLGSGYFGTNGVKSGDFTHGGTNGDSIYFYGTNSFTGEIDNFHIYELPDYTSTSNHNFNYTTADKYAGTSALKMTSTGAGRGAEALTNPDITGSSTGWNINTTCTYGTNNLVCTNLNNSSACSNLADLVIGKTYEVIYTITVTSGSVYFRCGTGASGFVTRTQSGTYREVQNCASSTKLYADGTNFYGTIESVSVKEILGEVTLPSAQIDALIAGNKYTKEINAKVDPTSLTYGSNLASGWDLTNWLYQSDVAIVDANTFTNNSASTGGIYKVYCTVGKVYKLIINATSTGTMLVHNGTSSSTRLNITTNLTQGVDQTFYFMALFTEILIQTNSTHTADIAKLELYQADAVTLTSRIGTKLVTVTPSIAGYTKAVLNFEATSGEVNQDLKLYLNGAGSVFVDNISLTQAYDYAIAWSDTVQDSGNDQVFMGAHSNTSSNNNGFFLYRYNIDNRLTMFVQDGSGYNAGIDFGIHNDNEKASFVYQLSRTGYKYSVKNNTVVGATNASVNIGKVIFGNPLTVGRRADNGIQFFKGKIAPVQIIRFTNIEQSNMNPTTFKVGQQIFGGGAETVLLLDWKDGTTINNTLKDYSAVNHTITGVNIDSTNRKRVN